MLIIDQNLVEIDDLLDKLVSAFAQLSEVEAYRKARAEFLSDATLQKKVQIWNENKEFIPFRADLRALQQEINRNEKVYALRLAENDLQQILSTLTQKITQGISEHIYVDEHLPLKNSKGGHHGRHHGQKRNSAT
ncbi:YlbF family regulator [Lactococcus kimchii]|uniref:YlbF family regulator n=1 Tax=Lactococcus sp. S-13 TaxID=2507158 RepID=UPI0010239EA8|nr:YlbF family regulator [Lactococcus sp. S-13]RZI49749.1 YlbF family regulator [Lactococcus sp. S-13]